MAGCKDYARLFQSWLEQVGECTAYSGVLPTGVTPNMPYILYDLYVGGFAEQFIQPVRVFAGQTTDIGEVLDIVDRIDEAVGNGGVLLHGDGINVAIYKGNPFYQSLDSGDETTKAGYVNLLVTIYKN